MARSWREWSLLAVGVWLLASPWVLDGSGSGGAAATAWLVGAALALLAPVQLVRRDKDFAWPALVLGTWLGISPWVLDYSHVVEMTISALLAGGAVAALSWGRVVERTLEPASGRRVAGPRGGPR